MAFLNGSVNGNTTAVNLTAVGLADWIHWIDATTTVRKASVTAQISTYTLTAGTLGVYSGDPRTVSWSDGSPTGSGSDTAGVYVNVAPNGFTFTIPASPRVRKVTFNVGYYNCAATMTAHLSDSSATDYVDNAPTVGATSTDRNYTFVFAASSGSATLNISWLGNTSGGTGGNVTINAASLIVLPAALPLLGCG